VLLDDTTPNGHAGVLVELADSRVVSCRTRLEGHPDAWVSGTVSSWLGAIVHGDLTPLESGGDSKLAGELCHGLHHRLFPAQGRSSRSRSTT